MSCTSDVELKRWLIWMKWRPRDYDVRKVALKEFDIREEVETGVCLGAIS